MASSIDARTRQSAPNPDTSYDDKDKPVDKDENNSSTRSSFGGAAVDSEKNDVPHAGQPQPTALNATDIEQQQPVSRVTSRRGAHVNDIGSVPNGGLTAWLQVAGAFTLFFNTWGIINTFGVYETYYSLDILKTETPFNIAWIGSIQAFLLLIIGVITGPIYDMGYFRELLLGGSFLVVFGHMMLSLCHTYWQVMLAQALCIGLGTGALFIPSVAILSTYFTTRLALATGIAASGSSLGGVLYPIILNQLVPKIGFPWAVRVIGFICLVTLFVPNLCMKVRVLPSERRKLVDTTAFTHWAYMLFCGGSFVVFCGLYMPFFFIQSFDIAKHITSENFAFYLLSLLNATSVFGRIFPNFLAVKVGPMNVIIPCVFISGILIFCLIPVKSMAGLIVIVLLFGFFSGSLVSLPPTIVVHLTPDRRFIGTRLGMCFAWVAFGTLLGSPIGGIIIDSYGYTAGWVWGGCFSIAGGVLILLSRVAHGGWKPATRV
ncbi:MFS general substrate transporter [Microthyrium microscopicum]|uniref:MFS general substrate transporter n=1 Tax=Microthyrium microscopicum TaxID=703497 RepID=A0A6A6UQP4_9PEZI|nr:MFS general substrate transporter [Microthyrium microscopicum]